MQCMISNYFLLAGINIFFVPFFHIGFRRAQPGCQAAVIFSNDTNLHQKPDAVLLKTSVAGHKLTLIHSYKNTAARNITPNNRSLNNSSCKRWLLTCSCLEGHGFLDLQLCITFQFSSSSE